MANVTDVFKNVTSDFLSNLSDSLTMRTIGEKTPYLDVSCVNLFTRDYPFVYDHVLRNYLMGTYYTNEYGCNKFTFYKERPTIRLADPYQDFVRLVGKWIPEMEFNTTIHGKTMNSYAESDEGVIDQHEFGNVYVNGMSVFSHAQPFNNGLSKCDLLYKTNENFRKGRYRTLVARFHTDTADSRATDNPTQTAISTRYGMSHGRNLLKETPDNPNGYDNPYCRVWTYHHEYSTYLDAIRPFGSEMDQNLLQIGESTDKGSLSFRTDPVENGVNSFEGGSVRLRDYGVFDPVTSRPFIAPTAKLADYFDSTEDTSITRISPKRCMLSIENLAWKDHTGINAPNEFDPTGLSPEQKGPFGGRIMWFPPYNISFNEALRANWNDNKFIGRGEPIYTYTNSERTGTLKFTLLIDHPSILDYWSDRNTGKDSGGSSASSMRAGNGYDNEGNGLSPNDVDDINSSDNKMLRFFAGCDILKARNQTYQVRVKPVKKEPEPTVQEEMNEPDKPELKTGLKIVAMLYFPNDYSGVDDRAYDKEYPIAYLMNGIGTQEFINESGTKTQYIAPSTQKDVRLYDENGGLIGGDMGGYEMRDHGISYVTEPITSSTVAKRTYFNKTQEYITNKSGNNYSVSFNLGGQKRKLAKIVGTGATKENSALATWRLKRWYYRVDNVCSNNVLAKHPESYIDTKSLKLNGAGYAYTMSAGYAKEMGVEECDDVLFVSFADLYVAVKNDPSVDAVLKGCYDKNNVELVRKVISEGTKENGGYKITNVAVWGHASSQGYAKSNASKNASGGNNNPRLASDRRRTLAQWLEANGIKVTEGTKTGEDVSYIKTQDPGKSHADSFDINANDQKVWRSAHVEITYDEVSVTSTLIQDSSESIDTIVSSSMMNNKDAFERAISNAQGLPTDIVNLDMKASTGQNVKKGGGVGASEETEAAPGDTGSPHIISKVPRYDNEGEFFETLSVDHPLIIRKLNEKVRYFDPAFHSISPEGFNARLTFLQQCTRQGNTYNAEMGNMAGNMAFGRPPVCVLRVGDFWYNKIIIDNINIEYGGDKDLQWDLNIEGIGVMPMYADVTIQFKFIGGSDLSGPIARLQNALSFNYYANTGVYDNRAEMVEFDYAKKDGIETKYHTLEKPLEKNKLDLDRKDMKEMRLTWKDDVKPVEK